ncbi:hypothetical protein ACSBR1_003103 [Camellia fascicularis]
MPNFHSHFYFLAQFQIVLFYCHIQEILSILDCFFSQVGERLEITGVGDPSGRDQGFSYVRTARRLQYQMQW